MKILYIDSPIDPPGGGQKSLLILLKNVKADKKVFLPRYSYFCEILKKEKIDYEIVPIARLFKEIKKYDPEIIHCNAATVKYSFFSAIFAKILKIPFVWHVRVVEKAFLKDDIVAFLSAKIIAVSAAVKNKFSKIWHKKISVIFNTVSDDFLPSKIDMRKELGVSETEKLIGIFSRFERCKGHDLFVESAFALIAKGYKLKFILCGNGEKKEKIKRKVYYSSISSLFIFKNYTDNIADYMNACDMVVSASTIEEAFGRTLIEAMSLGKVVVATNLGGHREIIENGINGFLCEPNTLSLTESLLKALNSDAPIKENAFNTFKSKFSLDVHISQINKIYFQLL
ncbi:MAG: glycosyltransferase family 4 protein [Elusimicrobia bacterium]|nr:glycosyltransferase family 4 protein [Elusimicrobiota bacterium]